MFAWFSFSQTHLFQLHFWPILPFFCEHSLSDSFCLFQECSKKVKMRKALQWLICKGSQAKKEISLFLFQNTLAFDCLSPIPKTFGYPISKNQANNPPDNWNAQWCSVRNDCGIAGYRKLLSNRLEKWLMLLKCLMNSFLMRHSWCPFTGQSQRVPVTSLPQKMSAMSSCVCSRSRFSYTASAAIASALNHAGVTALTPCAFVRCWMGTTLPFWCNKSAVLTCLSSQLKYCQKTISHHSQNQVFLFC